LRRLAVTHPSENPSVQAIVPAEKYIEILNSVLEMNQQIVKQNALIVQSVTMPTLIYKEPTINAPF